MAMAERVPATCSPGFEVPEGTTARVGILRFFSLTVLPEKWQSQVLSYLSPHRAWFLPCEEWSVTHRGQISSWRVSPFFVYLLTHSSWRKESLDALCQLLQSSVQHGARIPFLPDGNVANSQSMPKRRLGQKYNHPGTGNSLGPKRSLQLSPQVSIFGSSPELSLQRGLLPSANCFWNVLCPWKKMSLEGVFLCVFYSLRITHMPVHFGCTFWGKGEGLDFSRWTA